MKGLIGFCLKIGMFFTHGDPDCFDFDKKIPSASSFQSAHIALQPLMTTKKYPLLKTWKIG